MGPRARFFLAISASFLATPLFAQSGWLLPTDVQSKLEARAPAPSTGWALPNGLAFKADTSGARKIVPVDRPEQTLFSLGSLVSTGFSGTMQRKPVWRKNQPEPDQNDIAFRFLDPNGVSAQLMRVDEIGFAMNGAEIQRDGYDKLLARDIGQVFGVAIDNAEFRNLYLTATSAYGLNIIGPDDNNDTVEERLYTGQPDADWMPAQWGAERGAGPGSIWKVDGETGQISLFATVTFEDNQNQGAALGNIAFDALHEQLFVSDLQTGMIHRYDMDGTEQELFDHGILNDTPYDPETVFGITSDEFDVEDPDTWGFADEARRVWGLAAHGGRLYYAIADGPAVWSVGFDRKTGAFNNDAREEFIVPREHSRAEISDMVFAGDGALILGQRGPLIGTFEYENITRDGRGANLRYVREKDAQTGELIWVETPALYPVGFEKGGTRSAGGVAVGPHFDPLGAWDAKYCGATLWSTGETLRDNSTLAKALGRGGAAIVDGLQAQSVALPENGNAPPWKSYFFDADGTYPEDRTGHMGDVEVVGCRGAGGLEEHYSDGYGDDGSGSGDDCNAAPWLCEDNSDETGGGGDDEEERPACMTAQATTICNPATGEYELRGLAIDSDGHGLDRLKMSDPVGALTGFPQDIAMPGILQTKLTGLVSGQTAQIGLCGYNSLIASSGAPYPCCNATVVVTIPDAACEKEAN